jgi:exosortase
MKSSHKKMILIAFLACLFILAFFPVLKGLYLTWSNSDDYSHGFLIIPISVYIVWQKRAIFSKIPESPSWGGLVITVVSLLLYIFAHVGGITTLASITLILSLAGIIAWFFGFEMLRKSAFPLVFLLFMIPIPTQIYSELTIPLQLFVSKVSVWFSSNIGIPIYREGNVIHLPDRTMQVVQACSGLRSMVSILPLGAFLGYLMLQSNGPRWILFLSSIPVAIIVNMARVVILVTAIYFLGIDLTVGTLHTLLGLFVFCFAFAMILLIREILSKWDRSYSRR